MIGASNYDNNLKEARRKSIPSLQFCDKWSLSLYLANYLSQINLMEKFIFNGFNLSNLLITTQKVLFYTFNALCFKHFCVVVLHL